MSLLTNQTAVNTTTNFFEPGEAVEPNPLIVLADVDAGVKSFNMGTTVQLAIISIPTSYTSDTNFIVSASIQFSSITPSTEDPIASQSPITLTCSNGSLTFTSATEHNITLGVSLAPIAVTVPPLVANKGSGSSLVLNYLVNANQNFTAQVGVFNITFMELSAGGTEV
jgi:hypothetical protein